MLRQRSLWNTSTPEETAPVWTDLDGEQRAEVVAVLARVLAAVVAGESETSAAGDEEVDSD